MPEFAQFITIYETDEATEMDHPYHFFLPDLDLNRYVILMFKVSGPSGVQLKMTVNASPGPSIDFILDSTFAKPRSWHEIVKKGIFRVGDNHLLVEDGSSPPGVPFAKVSDIVVLYHAKTL